MTDFLGDSSMILMTLLHILNVYSLWHWFPSISLIRFAHSPSFFPIWSPVLIPRYILTFDDLELRTTKEREYAAFAFLGLGTSLNILFSCLVHLPYKFHDSIFLFIWIVFYNTYLRHFHYQLNQWEDILIVSVASLLWTWLSKYLQSRMPGPLGICQGVLQLVLTLDLYLAHADFPHWFS